jgi:hypothetical protein
MDNTTNTVANKGVSFFLLIASATGCTKQGLIFISLFSFFTSLHVSASTGHPQVKYTQSFLKAINYRVYFVAIIFRTFSPFCLQMEAARSTQCMITLMSTRCNAPEYHHLKLHHCGNLNSPRLQLNFKHIIHCHLSACNVCNQ